MLEHRGRRYKSNRVTLMRVVPELGRVAFTQCDFLPRQLAPAVLSVADRASGPGDRGKQWGRGF